ncbi:MAG: hypothetical protein ACRDPO_05615, partial [Streptosporangiaceae bacterium]
MHDGVSRLRQWYAAAPLWLKAVLLVVLLLATPLAVPAALIFAPYALSTSNRSVWASLSVAVWGLVAVNLFVGGQTGPRYLLTLLPLAVAGLAHVGPLGRRTVPCRTTAWTLLWSLPVGILAFHLIGRYAYVGPGLAWFIALLVLGSRMIGAWRAGQGEIRQQARGGAPGVPQP